MGKTTIDRLIINSPYEEPTRHWRYDRERRTFDLVEGRRPAGYVMATPGSRSFDDPGIFVEIAGQSDPPARQGLAQGRTRQIPLLTKEGVRGRFKFYQCKDRHSLSFSPPHLHTLLLPIR